MSDLDRLFYWRGITADYHNYRGELTEVPIKNRIQILQSMGVDVSSEEAIKTEAFRLDIKPWLSWLSPLEVVHADSLEVDVNFSPDDLNERFHWEIQDGNELLYSGVFTPIDLEEVGDYRYEGKRFSRRRLPLNEALIANYYSFQLHSNDRKECCRLAICPRQSFLPEERSNSNWGFILQLYTLRSKTNWGIGDFGDLRELVSLAAPKGVDLIGLNPFHTLQSDLSYNYSPYSPSDRRYLNPLYIDIEQVDCYEANMKPVDKISALRSNPHVDYLAVREVKFRALYACFERLIVSNATELAAYVEQAPSNLVDFANFEALSSWQPDDAVAQEIGREELIIALKSELQVLPNAMNLTAFHCFLQWEAEKQLKACQDLSEELGMTVGLMRDLAVGASSAGAEVRTNKGLFCQQASIGAPPDPLALTGQNWGVPPIDPAELRRTGFAHYIDLLGSNMRHCGALRIDHAMSLLRLWWCPPGETADQGAYIYYPFKELLGLLCLESHLNQCVVVAEDLGVVPDEFREAMNAAGLLGNRVFYFEKWQDDQFKHPTEYDFNALAMLNNHDVPTFLSWWNSTDLTLRDELNLLGVDSDLEQLIAFRQKEKAHLVYLLQQDGFLPDSWQGKKVESEADQDIVFALMRFASQVNSRYFMVQLEDLLLMDSPVNVPGTFKEHANWSRKLPTYLAELFSRDDIQALLGDISIQRNN